MKSITSPSYTIKLFENSESKDFNSALNIYLDEIAFELKTSSQEIIYWINNYSKKFNDELLIFGFYENDSLIGFSQCVYFLNKQFIVIDYFIIASQYRGNHSFQMIVALLKKFFREYNYDYNFIVTEVESDNKILLRLLKQNGFGEIQSKYFQPNLGINNFDSLLEAKLLYYPAEEDKTIKKESYTNIIETIYNDHYIRWYSEFLTTKEIGIYKDNIEKLKNKIYDDLKDDIYVKGGSKSINHYSEFSTKKDIGNTTILLIIIFTFTLLTLLLGKFFKFSLTEIVVLLLINASMVYLTHSLTSGKGIEQFKLLMKLFDKIK